MTVCRLLFPNCSVYVCLLSRGSGRLGPANSNSTHPLSLQSAQNKGKIPAGAQSPLVTCGGVTDVRTTGSACQREVSCKPSLAADQAHDLPEFKENMAEASCVPTCLECSHPVVLVALIAAQVLSPGFLWAQYRLSLAADFTDQLRSMKNF